MNIIKEHWKMAVLAAVSLILTLLTGLETARLIMVPCILGINVELLSYLTAGLFYLLLFDELFHNCSNYWAVGLLGVFISLFYTVRVLLLNNLWFYIDYRCNFRFDPPFSYKLLLRQDLVYQPEKYLICFGTMLIALGVLVFTNSECFDRFWDRFIGAVEKRFHLRELIDPEPAFQDDLLPTGEEEDPDNE